MRPSGKGRDDEGKQRGKEQDKEQTFERVPHTSWRGGLPGGYLHLGRIAHALVSE